MPSNEIRSAVLMAADATLRDIFAMFAPRLDNGHIALLLMGDMPPHQPNDPERDEGKSLVIELWHAEADLRFRYLWADLALKARKV